MRFNNSNNKSWTLGLTIKSFENDLLRLKHKPHSRHIMVEGSHLRSGRW